METKSMEKFKEKLFEEFEKLSKNELTASSLETIHKLTDTMKNIDKIMMLEDEEGGSDHSNRHGMSNRRYSRDSYNDGGRSNGSYGSYDGGSYDGSGHSGNYSNGRYDSYDSGDSYRGGRHYVRGHYSRDSGRNDMMWRMGEMMQYADNDRQREAIERCMRQLEQM